MEKISPRVDIAFKKIFGVEENKDLLISLINSIVGPQDQVTDILLLNPYNSQNFLNDKLSVLDIKAKGIDGKRFNIEIQISDEGDYDKRALYYWAKLYGEQLQASGEYQSLCKAIGIHILNFTSIFEKEKYHNFFHITEKETGLPYFTDLELHTIELKKFSSNNEDLNDIVLKVKNSLDRWVAFLTRHELLPKDRLPPNLNDSSLRKALTVLEVMNFTDAERNAYEEHLKWLRIEASTLKKYQEKSRAEGMAEGMVKGREEGIAEGQNLKAKLIAQALISEGMSFDKIVSITNLSLEELAKLKK
jgi:predicted transposase/invertase (TIGR01784 family)